MYKSILVPVELDHPETGEAALRAAGKLLDDGGRVVLLHVVAEIPNYAAQYIPEDVLDRRRREARAELGQIAAAAAGPVEAKVVSGARASVSILGEAEAMKADCIVIASHHPDLRDYFIGSTAGRVVRHADCSVLVLRLSGSGG